MSARLFLPVTATLLLADAVLAQDASWLQNFEEAKTAAQAAGKDLLVDFTGSDWCSWCKRLDKEVFAEAEFQQGVADKYVLVKLDFPQDESLVTPEIKAQNQKLQSDFQVTGFPTILLMDAAGRPYAQTGYQQGGPAGYLTHLGELQAKKASRDEHFGKAKDAEGVARAQHLAKGLESLQNDEVALRHYRAEIDEIIALDSGNEAGLRDAYAARVAMMDVESKVEGLAQEQKWSEIDALMVEVLAKAKGVPAVQQKATWFRAVTLLNDKQDFAGAIVLLDQAVAFDPDSDMGKRLAKVRADLSRRQGEMEKAGKDAGAEGAGEDKGEKKDGGD